MKILVTNHHLHEYTGTEVSTITLCKYLYKAGNEVTVYSKFFSKEILENFQKYNVRVIDDLNIIKNEKFDIGHIQHNISAYEVRFFFPKLPLVMWIHGKYPFLEQPPEINLNISLYLRTNQEGVDDLKEKGINPKKIVLFRNMVDPEIFYNQKSLNKNIKKALILSNKLPPEKEKIIIRVLKKLGIKYEFIGNKYKVIKNSLLPKYINKSDIVFSLGLGAMETMFCGRIPILFDYNFSNFDDGIVTKKNFNKLKEYNFSGRCLKRAMSEKDLFNDLLKYNHKDGVKLQKMALENYDANNQIKKLINIYKKIIINYKHKDLSKFEKEMLYNIVQIIQETKHYTAKNVYINIPNELENRIKIERELNEIKDSKLFKLWPLYNKFKNIFVK